MPIPPSSTCGANPVSSSPHCRSLSTRRRDGRRVTYGDGSRPRLRWRPPRSSPRCWSRGRRRRARAERRTRTLRAFKLAEFWINPGRVQIESGLKHYREAVRLDPRFGDAWSGLATAHMAQTWFSDLAATETMTAAMRAAERARQLDGSRAAPLRVLASVNHFHYWRHALAERQLRQALELEPGSSVTFSWLAELLADLRRFDEALACARRAQDALPRWLEPMTVAGNIHLFSGHPELAIAEYQRALAIEPTFGLANHFLGRAYLATGDRARAVEQLRRSDDLIGRVPFTRGDLGYALAISGARDEAERILAELLQARVTRFYPAFPIATIHLGLGRPDAALEWLERAVDERQVGYYIPSVDPIFDSLRTHPRFVALMRRMNLTE
jgi:tetratricopeptide (TPR) repeat protein